MTVPKVAFELLSSYIEKNQNEASKTSETEQEKIEAEAAEFVQKVLSEANDLSVQAKGFGYDEDQVLELTDFKLEMALENIGKEDVTMGRLIPLKEVDTICNKVYNKDFLYLSSHLQFDVAYKLGFSSKEFKLFVDSGCFCYEGVQRCEPYLYGSERTDHNWILSGHASTEAVYNKDMEELNRMRGKGIFQGTVEKMERNGKDYDEGAYEL